MRCLTLLLFLAACLPLHAQDRQDVTFQLNYNQTAVGQSVFVLGDLPELGSNDVTKAIKLVPAPWPTWRITLSLPTNTTYTYQFYRRSDGPNGELGSTSGTIAIGSPITASTAAMPLVPAAKAVLFHSTWAQPAISWRPFGSTGAFQSKPLSVLGPGRTTIPAEQRWIAWDLTAPAPALPTALAPREIEFFLTNSGGPQREPASGTHRTPLDGALVQDGQLFSYLPAPTLTSWLRDYTPATPPAINSTNLGGERRPYRVLLPRGYQQHTTRRYPVLYLHDGQNVFESGPFGTWNADDTAGSLTSLGRMRETIMVGIDNGPNRISDYAAPDAGGQADRYTRFIRDELKPLIDAQYRTLTGPDDTATLGSSMGAQVSLYMGWDFTPTFHRIGALSGAWTVFTSGFYDRVFAQPKRPIRIYLDSGDSGAATDNYWLTFNLRDNLLTRASGGVYTLENDLRHRIGIGQQHNEAAWAARLPDCLTFLLPPQEGDQPLLGFATGTTFDVNADGPVDTEDLYTQADPTPPSLARDLNLDGQITAADTTALRTYLRRNESQPR